MKKKKLSWYLSLGMALVLISGCKPSSNTSSENPSTSGTPSVEPSVEPSDEPSIDPSTTGIPEEVMNFNGDIDVLIYIEGQNGIIEDIGDVNMYGPSDLTDTYLARFAAAAREFKKIAPGVRINVTYCSIGEYNDAIMNYRSINGHLYHIMHGVEHVDRMIAKGYSADLSQYSNSEYYQAIDPSILELFNFGGFQGAVPYMMIPMGVFANTKILENKFYEYNDSFFVDQDTGDIQWTFEEFLNICESVFDTNQAALGSVTQDFISYSVPTINMQLRDDRTVKLDSDLVRSMLELEAELPRWSVYNYPRQGGADVKPGFEGVATWYGINNYINDEKYVFNAEAPWNIGYFALRAQSLNKDRDFDYLPWPAADQETGMTIGMIAEGLTIGNQCPIDMNEVPQCGATGQIEQDVAAYFTMFMNVDPRAINAKANIQWTDAVGSEVGNAAVVTGVLDMPIVKREFNFSFEDPSQGYVFDNQLRQYFEFYYTYLEDPTNPDIDLETFEGLKPGIKNMMNIFYNESDKRILFYSIPSQIPAEDGTTREIMQGWIARYGEYDVKLGEAGYVGAITALLPELENQINSNMELTWALLQEGLDTYYGVGKYDVSLNAV